MDGWKSNLDLRIKIKMKYEKLLMIDTSVS